MRTPKEPPTTPKPGIAPGPQFEACDKCGMWEGSHKMTCPKVKAAIETAIAQREARRCKTCGGFAHEEDARVAGHIVDVDRQKHYVLIELSENTPSDYEFGELITIGRCPK